MNKTLTPRKLQGSVRVPASKSQTIRALLIATFCEGRSIISNPLVSADTLSCLTACRCFGAKIEQFEHQWVVTGIGNSDSKKAGLLIIDTGNSGTTLYLGSGMAASLSQKVLFTGDQQIRSRPSKALTDAYRTLGAKVSYTMDEEFNGQRALRPGCPPFLIEGPLTGGEVTIECPTSQYLSSLLLAAPLAKADTRIIVPLLNERPYVQMTLGWLDEQGIRYEASEDDVFTIYGSQHYHPFKKAISGDFSSASFFLCAAAVTASTVSLSGLDENDHQGDKQILQVLESLGAQVSWEKDRVTLTGPEEGMRGDYRFDLNPIPDALPVLAVTSCYVKGRVILDNVPQARIKETDRITVMRQELTKLGAVIEEKEDGLVIDGTGALRSGTVKGHGDHRVIMACAIGALAADGPITIEGIDAVEITCPEFFSLLESLYV